MRLSTTGRTTLAVFGVDALFSVLTSAAYLQLLGLDGARERRLVLALLVPPMALKAALLPLLLRSMLRPLDRWRLATTSSPDFDAVLRLAGEAAYRAPLRFSIVWPLVWVSVFPPVTAALLWLFPSRVPLSPHAMLATVPFALACLTGALGLGFSLIGWLLGPSTGELSLTLRERGFAIRATRLNLHTRLLVLVLCLGLGPTTFFTSLALMSEVRARLRAAEDHSRVGAGQLALLLERRLARAPVSPEELDALAAAHSSRLDSAFIADPDGRTLHGVAARELLAESPRLGSWFAEAVHREPCGALLDPHGERALAYCRVPGQVVGMLSQTGLAASAESLFTLGLFCLLVLTWAPLTATLLARTVAGPVVKVAEVLREIGRRGEVAAEVRAPVYFKDEIGDLAEGANEMIGSLAASAKLNRDYLAKLQASYQEAKEAIRVRDDFLSVASHELKTPLATLALGLQWAMLRLARGEPVDKGALERADRQIKRLTALINDLLDASRIQAGRLVLQAVPVPYSALVRGAVAAFRAAHADRSFELLEAEADLMVKGDVSRLEQVLTNLLDNAVKYSPAGGTVRVELKLRENRALLSVTDAGIGIGKADQERLFTRFFRAAPQTLGRYGGLGLGLYISRDIVERHGGRIWVESELGRGSTFFVSLPLLEPERAGRG
ncbi:MAG: sensor histidine kinase [Myxococcaceae bacterium]